MDVEVNVEYPVEDYDLGWRDICEGVVRTRGHRLGNHREMATDSGYPFFFIEIPDGWAEDRREEFAAEVGAECAKLLDFRDEVRTKGAVQRLRQIESALREAHSVTSQVRTAIGTVGAAGTAVGSVVELVDKATSAWDRVVAAYQAFIQG